MKIIPPWFPTALIDQANRALCYKGFHQEVIAFPAKVAGDWIILIRTCHTCSPLNNRDWSCDVSLCRVTGERLTTVGLGSKQLVRSLAKRCNEPNFQAIDLETMAKPVFGIDAFVALLPVRAYPRGKGV